MREGIEAVPTLVSRLYEVVRELEEHFPGRRFTLDGHLVGSIGEVLAAYHYELELLTASTKGRDAVGPDGHEIEIKATQRRSVALRHEPEHLLVLALNRDGSFSEVYNGPGSLVWQHAGPMQKNGQRLIGLGTLSTLMEDVPQTARLRRRMDRSGR